MLKKRRRKSKEEKTKQQKKNDCKNSKGISGTFSGVVVGSVGSVHFQIVPWSGLYFLRSILPRRFPVIAYVCWSLQCLFYALTQGGQWWTVFFFRLSWSVALWGGRDAANK